MSNFLNPDNRFFSLMGKVWDVFVINMIWLVLCLPIVTIIPATTALYYTMVKVIRRERGYVMKEFFRSFKRNFRQGSGISILAVVTTFVLYVDFRYSLLLIEEGKSTGNTFLGIFLVIAFLAAAVFMYISPVLSRFDMKFGALLKTSFYMATRHLLTTLGLLVLAIAVGLGCYLVVPGVFLLPVVGTLLASFFLERVFKKYMPEKEESTEGSTEDNREKDEWYLE